MEIPFSPEQVEALRPDLSEHALRKYVLLMLVHSRSRLAEFSMLTPDLTRFTTLYMHVLVCVFVSLINQRNFLLRLKKFKSKNISDLQPGISSTQADRAVTFTGLCVHQCSYI